MEQTLFLFEINMLRNRGLDSGRQPSAFSVCVFITALLGAPLGVLAWPSVCPAQSRSYQAMRELDALGLVSVWQTQLAGGALDQRAHVSLYVSPTRVRKIYDVIEDGRRTSFAGPTAEHDSDIRLRTILMSDRKATLEVREVPLITLYAQTASGRLESIDGETGQRRWSVRIGRPGAPAYTPMGNDDHVVAVCGASLYVISPDTGKLIFERPLAAMAAAGPTVVDESVFLPTSSQDFHVYSLSESSRRFAPKAMTSFGRVIDQPRLSKAGIVWTTDRGSMFVGDPESQRSKFKVTAHGRLIGAPAFRDPDRLFVAMAEGFVLAAEAAHGRLLWEFAAGEPLASSVYLAGDAVYVGSVDRNLFAIDAETGSQRWVAPGVTRIVAHGDGMLYGASANRKLVVVEAATGGIRGRVTLRDGEKVIENRSTDRVYLLSDSGRLRCVRRVDAPWPTLHIELPQPDEQAEPTVKPADESSELGEASEEQPPADNWDQQPATADEVEDPFGAGDDNEDPFATGNDEDDPFATGDDDEDPFGGGAEKEDDPFGDVESSSRSSGSR